jgi:uncharacterized membrane protein
VQQLDDTHVHLVAEIRGESREWTTEIVEQQLDKKVAWKTIEGQVETASSRSKTRVSVRMDVEGE